jgi:formylmethanofuran dehydrogenase subunit A
VSSIRIRGGRVYDPSNGVDGEVRDIGVRDGRIVALDPQEPVAQEIDASGCIVMAGGIDMHSHIGGGKMNLARLLLPEDHRSNFAPAAMGGNPLELPSCGTCIPGTLATGYRYAEMGYTAAFEPAMVAGNARHAHMEMGDVPILDHGAYVMLGNDELFLRLLHQNAGTEALRDYVGYVVHATKAMGHGRSSAPCRARSPNWDWRTRCTSTPATSVRPATSRPRSKRLPRSTACPGI